MASDAALSVDERTWFSNDKPLLAAQSIRLSPTDQRWTVSSTTASDESNASFPVRRCHDGMPHLITKPDATGAATWYLTFSMGALIEFDCAFIMGHNFKTLNLTTIDLEIADDYMFSSGLKTIGDFVPSLGSTDTRIQDLALFHTGSVARRYTDVQFVRLKLSRVGNFTPQLGELVLGKRTQMQYNPDRPFDEKALVNNIGRVETLGGVKVKTAHMRNMHRLAATWTLDDTDRSDDWETFWATDKLSFAWVYNPNSEPEKWRLMSRNTDELSMPLVGPNVREISIDADEQGPERFFLEEET